jgi:hypothetical protein
VPVRHNMTDLYNKWKADPKSLDEHAKSSSSWIQKGMAEDAKK